MQEDEDRDMDDALVEEGDGGQEKQQQQDGDVDEIVDKDEAFATLDEMRVTLEQDDGAEVNKNPPSTARQVLSGFHVNKRMMTHCITGETDNSMVKQPCALVQKCNYYCFVSKMDPKGSTPSDILDVIYSLDMVQRYYTNQRPMPNSRGAGEEIFDVPKAGPNGARSMRHNGAVFHKMYENDETVTVPTMKMKLFIEQANTGGESPLVMFFMFCVVEVPITFDLVDTIYRACTKNAIGREKFVCDDMKRIWVNIAHRHQTFSGSGSKSLESMLQIQFNDIFDPDSPNCFWKMSSPQFSPSSPHPSHVPAYASCVTSLTLLLSYSLVLDL